MKKVFKKMKKRLSGEGNTKLEGQLSGKDSDMDASNASNASNNSASKPQSPRRPSTVQEEDTSQPVAKSEEPNSAPAATSEEQKEQSQPEPGVTESKEQVKGPTRETVAVKGTSNGGKPDSQKKRDDSSVVIKTYSDVPVLESNRLPRGGISIETKAVGRVQVSYPFEFEDSALFLSLRSSFSLICLYFLILQYPYKSTAFLQKPSKIACN